MAKSTPNKLGAEHIDVLVNLRGLGMSYADIAKDFATAFKMDISADGLRRAYINKAGAAPQATRTKTVHVRHARPKSPKIAEDNSRILVISDMHVPYHHPDTFAFLEAVKKKYKPTRVVCVGDEVDHHALSFHDSDPDLPSAGDELRQAIQCLQPLYKLFPNVDLIDSNHGSMVYRKGKHHGIPRKYLRDYGDVLEAPTGWVWQYDLMLDLPGGNRCYFHHGMAKDVLKIANQRGTCVVQGHFHTSAIVEYSSNPANLLWGMNVGCSIDNKSYAFAYDKTNLGRPIISHGIIIGGQPRILPMPLLSGGRWNGEVP